MIMNIIKKFNETQFRRPKRIKDSERFMFNFVM